MIAPGVAAPVTRIGGAALMAAVVLMVVAPLLQPGGPLINPVDQTDFALAIEAMADNASLTHLATMLTIIGMLLYGLSFMTLLRLPRQSGMSDLALRAGILLSMFGWGVFVIAMSMRHMTIHLMQRGMGESPMPQAAFEGLALNVYTAMAGVVITQVAVYPVASFLTGWGLASRMREMSIFKLASCGLMLMAILGFANFLVVQHATGIDVEILLWINTSLLWFGSICLFVIGWGMYTGRGELSSPD